MNDEQDGSARLRLLLDTPSLDLHATFRGKTAEEWATSSGYSHLADMIHDEVCVCVCAVCGCVYVCVGWCVRVCGCVSVCGCVLQVVCVH